MQNELDTIIAGLKAEIQREILNHRGDDAGLIASFAVNVRRHGERIAAKLSNLRAANSNSTAIDAAAATANALVNDAIAAVEKAGRVEFVA